MDDFKKLILKLSLGNARHSPAYSKDILSRKLIFTPFGGRYGPAGWVVAINGSPPRLILLLENSFSDVVAIANGRARKLGRAQAKTAVDYIEQATRGKTAAFELSPESKLTRT